MASIVSCPCCTKPISRSAASCISCGHPVKETLDFRLNLKLGLIGVVILFAILGLIKVTNFDVVNYIKTSISQNSNK